MQLEDDDLEQGATMTRADALDWLDGVNRYEPEPPRDELFTPNYFRRVDLHGDWRQKNKHVLFQPANTYENWLAHGAIPQCFRHFISDLRYVGRAELAVYVRLVLLMDHHGIYYGPQDDLKEGLYKQAKQVGPVLRALGEKHLVLASPEEVAIPWQRGQLRRIYQRPRAAYTIAKLHHVGFLEEEYERGSRKLQGTRRVFLDQATYLRCLETLAHAFKKRAPAKTERPPLSLDLVAEWLYRTFIDPEEAAASGGRIDQHFINEEAQPGTAKRPKRRKTKRTSRASKAE